jgi:hypothetical protein
MNTVLIGLLFCFWLFLAYRAFQRGAMGLAAVYVLVGVVLAIYRLSRRRN